MGVLIDGAWRDGELPQETGVSGEFRRADSRFRERITADGSSGFKAEAGRYHLYVAHGCPWAHRTLIYRSVKKLQGQSRSPIRSLGSGSKAGPSPMIPPSRTVRLTA
jgi:putative glutathione S-transferase